MSHIRRLKKIKKDYQRKNLQNPFFHQRAKGKSCYWSKWFTLGLFLIFIFIIWFFLASPLFKIKNITVRGLTRSPESDIQNIIWQQTSQHRYLLFREGNIILFNKKEAQKQILGNFNFANLKIDKHWPQTLIVVVSERPYAFIFQQGNDFFYASSDAYIIKEKFVEEGDKGKYLILENKNTNNLIDEAGKINLTTNYLNFILDLSLDRKHLVAMSRTQKMQDAVRDYVCQFFFQCNALF